MPQVCLSSWRAKCRRVNDWSFIGLCGLTVNVCPCGTVKLRRATCSFVMMKAAWKYYKSAVLCYSVLIVSLRKCAQHTCCHPKIFEPSWYLSELALNFIGIGNKFSGIVPSIPQWLPNVPRPQNLVSVCPRTRTTVGSWKPSLWSLITD